MKAFEYYNATSVDDAVKLLTPEDAQSPLPEDQPRALAGGQDLLTTMKSYITQPSRVVNLKTIAGLDGIADDGRGGVRIGALATVTDIAESELIRRKFPGVAQAAESVASPQIRNFGTLGGNLCQRPRCWYFRLEDRACLKRGGSQCYAFTGENKYHAIFGGGPSFIVHPSDLAPILVALNATVTIAGPGKASRELDLQHFFTLPKEDVTRENVLKPDELITSVHIPASPVGERSTYLKFQERESLDFAMSAVAAAVELAGDKTVKSVRLVLGGVAPIPWHIPRAEAALVGKKLDESTIDNAAKIAVEGSQPLSQNAYKVPLTQALVRRALTALNT